MKIRIVFQFSQSTGQEDKTLIGTREDPVKKSLNARIKWDFHNNNIAQLTGHTPNQYCYLLPDYNDYGYEDPFEITYSTSN